MTSPKDTSRDCVHCGNSFRINPMKDAMPCPHCKQRTPTGMEEKFRKVLEKVHTRMPWPKSVAARAASYANQIYKFASEGKELALADIEDRIQKRFGPDARAGEVQLRFFTGRSLLDMRDSTPGVILIEADGRSGKQDWRYVYVVFRGSAGDRSKNMSGWDQTGQHNIDWRVNLENTQQRPEFGDPEARVHQGFYHLYMSMQRSLKRMIGYSSRAARGPCNIIVTGHSLGAGLSQICAYDLLHSGYRNVSCFPFCPPRAGNLEFVLDFNQRISNTLRHYPSERQSYYGAFAFIQGLDPVSIGQKRSAFRGVLPSEGRRVIDEKGLVGRALYAVAGIGASTKEAEAQREALKEYGLGGPDDVPLTDPAQA